MKRVLTAAVLIPIVLLVLFKAPIWLFTLAVGAVAMAAAHEYLALIDAYGVQSPKVLGLLLSGGPFIALALRYLAWNPSIVLISIPGAVAFSAPLLFLIASMRNSDLRTALPTAAYSSLVIPYIAWTLFCLVLTRMTGGGTFLILYLFIVVWSGDIFAYYVGRAIGKHKLAPRISPGKSWEGAVASVVGSALIGFLFFLFSWHIVDALVRWKLLDLNGAESPWLPVTFNPVWGGILSMAVNVAAQLGDLVESMIKRGANVKDSGTLLPGHGGVLDRIDALLFAAPVVYFYAMINSHPRFYTPLIK